MIKGDASARSDVDEADSPTSSIVAKAQPRKLRGNRMATLEQNRGVRL